MQVDQDYYRDEHLVLRVSVVVTVLLVVSAVIFAAVSYVPRKQVSPADVWPVVYALSNQAELDPEFVYALAWAESGLNAKARSPIARGMMQLTRPAWNEVSEESYRMAWEWESNLQVGIDYLVFCRDFLLAHDSFSYPLLAAAYRYGPYHVKHKKFDIKQLKRPTNEIYTRLFDGDIHPVAVPIDKVIDVR